MRPEDFKPPERVRVERLSKKIVSEMQNIVKVWEQTSNLPDDTLSAVNDLDELTRLVLPGLPADMFDRLRDRQKLEIANTFLKLSKQR